VPENLELKNDSRENLRQALEVVIANPEEPIIATAIRQSLLQTSSKPVRIRGIDGNEYIVKGKQAGRQIINDQVVARLGQVMNAPVGEPCLVEISQDLLDLEPEFSYLATGIAHATKFIPNCSDDHGEFLFANSSANHSRFASLAVLYGWIYADDHQFLCENQSPRLVYSVDHGHFFVGGPDWTSEHLSIYVDPAQPDHLLVRNCKLNNEDLIPALAALERISEQTIVQVVGGVPEEWGISIDERLTLVEYLIKRKHELLANF
jgi:hypothetical protein